MQPYTYRTATIADIEKLRVLGLNSFGQFQNQLTADNWKKLETILDSENTYLDLLGKSTCFICEDGNEIVGMAYYIPSGNPTAIFQEDWCYLRMVGVRTEYDGKGIGRHLILLCLGHAKKTGEKTVALHTSEFMDAARHIYERMGFYRLKEIEPRFEKKYWLYLFEL
ncbi:GNAT family N-acetyltransferase [Emticicia agri]|uniref:GNAT family N-acetyltransferase n=1 Tax=Emticicia agri TaxID=2492393 RepID=A0A4Q5M231_9BACT|nr:GNAT family N-acetyltransferase [Emticicia agri]RYU96321.1 GNAT family N-acetyltransferase [Emticicia agri]